MDSLIAELSWTADPTAWLGLVTLVLLEIVLGIDNLVFIAILADKLPEGQRDKARVLGLTLALLMRLVLLLAISALAKMTEPFVWLFDHGFSVRDVIVIVGGVFLIYKGTMELHERLEGRGHGGGGGAQNAIFWQVIVQIVALDAIFSLDSVITAVGMVQHVTIMMVAVVIAVAMMMLASGPLMRFVSRHPTVVILCLGFLLMIGFSLVVEGLGFHIPKGYLYAAIGFSILIEAANQTMRRNRRRHVGAMDMRDRTARAVLRLLRGKPEGAEQSGGEFEELGVGMDTAGPVFAPEESLMIERVLKLRERSVRSIMVPRPDVVWLDVEDAPETVLAEIVESGRSRFPVSRGDVDQLVGVVHAKDLLEQQARTGTVDLVAALREPVYVSEGVSVLKLLARFQASNVHMGVVIDEHGTFEGIVTPTDILIAIAGDFPERAGDEEPDVQQREDGSFLLDGRMAIEEVEQSLGVDGLVDEEGDYTTLAGFVLDRLEHLPKVGETVEWEGWTFRVEELDGHRIEKVSVEKSEGTQGAPSRSPH